VVGTATTYLAYKVTAKADKTERAKGFKARQIISASLVSLGSGRAVVLASSQVGFALSTTHVATGAIIGSGVGKKLSEVRWGTAGRMALAWR
jgi:phosphate/sulfate permease